MEIFFFGGGEVWEPCSFVWPGVNHGEHGKLDLFHKSICMFALKEYKPVVLCVCHLLLHRGTWTYRAKLFLLPEPKRYIQSWWHEWPQRLRRYHGKSMRYFVVKWHLAKSIINDGLTYYFINFLWMPSLIKYVFALCDLDLWPLT